MFKLRHFNILCTKWAQLKCDACYRSQIYHAVASPLLFKTVWRRLGIEVMSFWSLVLEFSPILAWYRFPAAEEFVVVFDLFFIINVPNVLYRWKVWTQAGHFSTRTLLIWSHAVVIAACGFAFSCWNTQGFPWNRCRLEGSICCSKTFLYLSAFIVPSKPCKLPIPYALMHTHTIRDAGFWTEHWWHAGRSPSSLAFKTVHFKWALADRTRQASNLKWANLVNKSSTFLCLNICYVLYVLLWIKYWLMWFESLLVFIL